MSRNRHPKPDGRRKSVHVKGYSARRKYSRGGTSGTPYRKAVYVDAHRRRKPKRRH